MIQAAALAAALATHPTSTAIHLCLKTMDGAVYNGDPSNRKLMESNVHICKKGLAELKRMPVANVAERREQDYIAAMVLDRTATLSYMGLGDAVAALAEVRAANRLFKIAASLHTESAAYHEAAAANLALTQVQLRTLEADPLISRPHTRSVSLHETATR